MSTERGNVTFIVGGFNLSNNTRWNCKYQSVIRENVQRNGENTSIGRNRNRFRFREIIERTGFVLDRWKGIDDISRYRNLAPWREEKIGSVDFSGTRSTSIPSVSSICTKRELARRYST